MDNKETRRRTIMKGLIWRFIGIFWTWGGAYIIIMMLPESKKSALNIATLVTAWHHSTRLIMYYGYERIWQNISWGKPEETEEPKKLPTIIKIRWFITTALTLVIIFWLLFHVTPKIKGNQKELIQEKSVVLPR